MEVCRHACAHVGIEVLRCGGRKAWRGVNSGGSGK
jgi:hypothetical protein